MFVLFTLLGMGVVERVLVFAVGLFVIVLVVLFGGY